MKVLQKLSENPVAVDERVGTLRKPLTKVSTLLLWVPKTVKNDEVKKDEFNAALRITLRHVASMDKIVKDFNPRIGSSYRSEGTSSVSMACATSTAITTTSQSLFWVRSYCHQRTRASQKQAQNHVDASLIEAVVDLAVTGLSSCSRRHQGWCDSNGPKMQQLLSEWSAAFCAEFRKLSSVDFHRKWTCSEIQARVRKMEKARWLSCAHEKQKTFRKDKQGILAPLAEHFSELLHQADRVDQSTAGQLPQLTIIIMIIFYCGLVVHITDTKAQTVVSYTSAHITETVFAHDQHWEEQSCISSPQLYRHSQKHRKWINHTVGHYTTGVSTCPALRGARHFPSTSCFLCLVCTQCFCWAWCYPSSRRNIRLSGAKNKAQGPVGFRAYILIWLRTTHAQHSHFHQLCVEIRSSSQEMGTRQPSNHLQG